jgi:hypothetical protein
MKRSYKERTAPNRCYYENKKLSNWWENVERMEDQ